MLHLFQVHKFVSLVLLFNIITKTCFIFFKCTKIYASLLSHCADFRYMRFVYNANDPRLEASYDYIVNGGGTAGCPLAATLSANYPVLLLERGSVPTAYPSVLRDDEFLTTLMQEDNGNTPAQKFTSEDGVPNVRGRVLGGSSMINAGFYTQS